MLMKSSESSWGQRPKLTKREDPHHPHGSRFDLSCGNQSPFKSTLQTPPDAGTLFGLTKPKSLVFKYSFWNNHL